MPHMHHASFESFWLSAALIVLALIYVRGWIHLRRFTDATIEGWRASSFIVGLLVIWFAVSAPLGGFDHELLTAHMVQHLLLMTVAAPLVWLGAPFEPLLRGLPQQFAEGIHGSIFHWTGIKRLGKALTHPAVCWLAAALTLVAWHIPAVFMFGMRSGMSHGIEQASFLVTGLLFWWPVIQPWPAVSRWPKWSIVLYLFFATLPCDILSGFLVFCDRVVYPAYFSSSHPFGLSPLQDQQCAGALMWTVVTIIYLGAGVILTAQLLSPYGSQERWVEQHPSRPSTATQATRPMEVI